MQVAKQSVENSYNRLTDLMHQGKDMEKAVRELATRPGEPLTLTDTQMNTTVDFFEKMLVIVTQADYSLVRQLFPEKDRAFGNLPATDQDAKGARHIGHGFGIGDPNILHLKNFTIKQLSDFLHNRIKRRYRELSRKQKRCLLVIYCAGHGLADQRQWMVLNSTSGNIYPIEETARDICRFTKNLTTTLCIYDMCKDELTRYPQLSRRAAEIKK